MELKHVALALNGAKGAPRRATLRLAEAGCSHAVKLLAPGVSTGNKGGGGNGQAEISAQAIAMLLNAISALPPASARGRESFATEEAQLFSAATAADNLFSALYLSILGLLPTLNWLANRYHRPAAPLVSEAEPAPAPSAQSLCFALAIATLLVVAADALSAWSQLPGMKYIWLTLLTLLISTLLPRVRFWCAGGFELGVVLSFPFFGSIAAGADIASMLMVAPILIALVVILLAIHILFLLVAGHWLKLSLPELLTASNAAVLGATTAPAMAAAKGWTDQITPGVLVGVLGYALGTLIGSALFHML